MAIDHTYVQVAADGSGKKIGNVKQTDPDAAEVYLQKTVTWDPEDESDTGGLKIENGAARFVATPASTADVTSVDDSATSVTLVSANPDRLGVSIVNDSTARLRIKCGTTASATSYTVSLGHDDSWECPVRYTGDIDGIWDSDPGTGAARITEYTA